MKIRTDLLGELQIPKAIIEDWEEHKSDYDIEDFLGESIHDYLKAYRAKLIDRDLAIFLRDYETGILPPQGGYYASSEFSFDDGGNRYTVLAFGWNDENGEPDIHMVGYKQPAGQQS